MLFKQEMTRYDCLSGELSDLKHMPSSRTAQGVEHGFEPGHPQQGSLAIVADCTCFIVLYALHCCVVCGSIPYTNTVRLICEDEIPGPTQVLPRWVFAS